MSYGNNLSINAPFAIFKYQIRPFSQTFCPKDTFFLLIVLKQTPINIK